MQSQLAANFGATMKLRRDLGSDFFDQGFNESTDPFGRKDLAERLTRLFDKLEHGTVSILHGRWGTGKSVFAKQWTRELEKNGIPAIYFDAFASDYIENPFNAVSAAFIRAAASARKEQSNAYQRFLNAAIQVSKKVGASSAKIGTKVITLGVIGAAEIDALTELKDDLSSSFGDISETAVKKVLEEQADAESTFRRLRESLADLPSLLAEGLDGDAPSERKKASLVVVIDELDRCRPDFALGILEVLKHFFRADRVHFVLVTNRKHLLLSVEKRYGISGAADEYLQKFYDFIIYFEERIEDHRGTAGSIYANQLLSSLLPSALPPNESNDLKWYLAEISRAFDLTLRQVEALVTNAMMAYLAAREGEFRPTIAISFLAALKAFSPDEYLDAKMGRLKFEEFRKFVALGKWSEQFNWERVVELFQYYLDPSIDPNSEQFRPYGGGVAQFHFSSRHDIVPYLCNAILDRFGRE